MEWRIILAVLCLIGILHLPRYVDSAETVAPTTSATSPTTVTTTATSPTTVTTTATSPTTVTTTATSPTTVTTTATSPTTVTTATTTPTTATTATTHLSGATTALTAAGTSSTGGSSTAGSQATTASAPASLGAINLVFKLTDPFQVYYSDLNDTRTKSFVENIKTQFLPVYKKRYPNYIGMIINKLSAGSVISDSTLQFNTTNFSTPNATDAKDTLVQAINSGGINLTIDNTSISAVAVSSNAYAATATSSSPTIQTATASTPANRGLVNLNFKLKDTFQAVYSELTNPQTIVFVENIKSQFHPVYKNRYPNYFGMIINNLSSGSVNVNSTLQFDTTNSTAPNATDVRDTLIQAINSGGINLTIDNTSISAEAVSSNGTSTTATQTTTVATTALVLANYNITFKILALYTSDLANLNSVAGSLLRQAVYLQLNGFFSPFKGFYQTDVWRFRNGSIIVDAWAAFIKNINAPNATDLAKQFAAAVRNQTTFLPIDPTSINVTDFTGFTASKSPVLASMLTALWMTLASLLLSAMMH